MANYIVDFTDIRTTPIEVAEGGIDVTSTDAALFGRIRLEYGELLNETLLHLLEHFGCPEDSVTPGTPNLDASYDNLLANPVIGQMWFNSTTQVLHEWDGTYWIPLRGIDDIAANWGSIGTGQQLPKPVSQTTGYEFDYDECIWSVGQSGYESGFSSMTCGTDSEATVTMEYKLRGSSTVFPGTVNYLIIGIKGNTNLGTPQQPPALPGESPTPTPTVTPSVSTSPGAVPVTPTVTPTNSTIPDACGSARFRSDVNYYYRSSEGLIDVPHTQATYAWSFYGDSYTPSRYNEGDLCDTDNWNFAMGYYSNSGGWNIKLRKSTSSTPFNLNYTTVPGLITTGQWHAIMFVIDTNIGVAKLYVDKVLAKTWNSGLSGFNLRAHNDSAGGMCYWGIDDQVVSGVNGRVAHVWAHNGYYDPDIYWDYFFDSNNMPKDIGADGSGAVGVQPKSYFKNGHASDNGGSLNDWTEIGSVECAGAPFPAGTTATPTPTTTATPTPVPDPITGRLYMSPAVCDPGTPGPGGSITYHHPTCGTVSKSAYDQSTYVSIQGLTGGVPPYIVWFETDVEIETTFPNVSGLLVANSNDPNYNNDEFTRGTYYPNSAISKTYFGGTNGGAGIRTNVLPGEIVYTRLQFVSAEFYSGYDYQITNNISGYIRVQDSVGQQVRWWIPASEEKIYFFYESGCPLGGTNHTGTDPINNNPGVTAWWTVSWNHHGIPADPTTTDYASACDDCGDCIN